MLADPEASRVMTLEAFADTIIPGRKRSADDPALAGAADDPGTVEAGALDLLSHPAGGLADSLFGLAHLLNTHAQQYAAEHTLTVDSTLPAFVALPFSHRLDLVARLTAVDHPEKAIWVGLALFANMAFDSAAHLSTPEALAAGHPGLTLMGYARPDADGLFRFPRFSYGRQLAQPHPDTTPEGNPA